MIRESRLAGISVRTQPAPSAVENDQRWTRGESESLSEYTYRRLADAILTGEIPAGPPLDVGQLCEAFGVSRTPVREALIRLQHQGIVTTRANRYTHVHPVTPDQAKVSLRLTRHLAGSALRLLVWSRNPLIREDFLYGLEDYGNALESDDPTEARRQFFRCFAVLAEAAEGTSYATVMSEMGFVLERDLQLAVFSTDKLPSALNHLADLVEAIGSREAASAERHLDSLLVATIRFESGSERDAHPNVTRLHR